MLPQLKHNNLKIVGELYIFANCLLIRQSSQNLKSFQQNVHNSNINAICPPKSLKIDRRFVHGAVREARDAALVRGLAALASSLGLRVVAEGVETAE